MATKEQIIVELDADIQGFETKMDEASQSTKNLKNESSTLTTQLKKLGPAIAATFTVATVTNAIDFNKELRVSADLAGVSVERMQSLAFATNTVGITMEQLGDISKDTSEKLGEFLATGGGGFQDFVDVMKLTDEQAIELAENLTELAGPDALGEMVRLMEAAGVESEGMILALEGMASEAAKLIPLYEDNATGLKKLENGFTELGLVVTEEESQKLSEVGLSFAEIGNQAEAAGTKIVASLAPALTGIADAITFVIVKISQIITLFESGFTGAIEIAGAALNDLINGTDTYDKALKSNTDALRKNFEQLLSLKPAKDAANEATQTAAEKTEEENQKIREQNDLLLENQQIKQDSSDAFLAQLSLEDEGVALSNDFRQGVFDTQISNIGISQKAVEDFNRKTFSSTKKSNEDQQKSNDSKWDNFEQGVNLGFAANAAFFDNNKAINAGLIVADTAAAVMSEYKRAGPFAAAAAAAAGAAQLAANNASAPSGGTVPAVDTGTTITNDQANFVADTSNLDVSAADESGFTSGVIRVEFATDSGDDLLDAIAGGLNESQRQGR